MKLSFFLLFFLLFLAPLVSGETYKQFNSIDFIEVIRIDGAPSNNILANITITDPDNLLLIGYEPMTYNSVNKTFNYSLSASFVQKTGTYERCITASGNGLNSTGCFYFNVTPSGKTQSSILENPFLIVFLFMGLILLVMGISLENPWLGFVSSIMFLLGGIYTFIYGINNEQTMYSQGVSITLIGLSIIFMFLAGYEFWAERGEE